MAFTDKIKPVFISGKEVLPIVEGGKGIAATNGQSAGAERWRALITTTIQPPRTEAELMKNPLGLKIEDVSWTPDAS